MAVEGTAQEVLTAGVFVLTDSGESRFLLVVDRQRTPVRAGDRVRVAGELRPFRLAEAAEVIGQPVDETRLASFDGATYVEARLVQRSSTDD